MRTADGRGPLHTDFRLVTPLIADLADVVVPDLRGFGSSDKHPVHPADGYSAAALIRQARTAVR
jgi:pimeloyl-ACP methyl ester carboxylesterase